MSRVITREETKQLTRSIPKTVAKENTTNIDRKELYFGGNGVFRWYFSKGRVPYGMEKVGIQLKDMYNKVGNKYERKTLKELDDYLYYTLNKNS